MRLGGTSMVVVMALALSLGSLTVELQALPQAPGCCVCDWCGQDDNARTQGDLGGVMCIPGSGSTQCQIACGDIGCGGSAFENASCTDPSLAEACGESNVMAPAAAPVGLASLAVLLAGAGAFYLRRRRI